MALLRPSKAGPSRARAAVGLFRAGVDVAVRGDADVPLLRPHVPRGQQVSYGFLTGSAGGVRKSVSVAVRTAERPFHVVLRSRLDHSGLPELQIGVLATFPRGDHGC